MGVDDQRILRLRTIAPAERTRRGAVIAKASVRLPVGVALPGMPTVIECEGATVAEALADCAVREPRLRGRLFRQDGTPWVGVALNGRAVPPEEGAFTPVEDGDEIRLLPNAGAC